MRAAVMAMVLALLAASASASAPLPAGYERYIVVVHAKGTGAGSEVAREARMLGASVEADLGDRLIVTGPPAAMEALRKHAAVRYVQTAVVGAAADAADLAFQAIRAPDVPLRTHTGLTWSSGDYVYDGAGNISGVGSSLDPGTQGYRAYGYDALTRLTRAEISGVSQGAATYEYSYDIYGNRTGVATNGTWNTVGVTPSTNRLSDAGYDTRGNQTSLGVTAATYDGFGMVTSYRFDDLNVETYVYTASDERIGVLRGSDWTWSLRDEGGKVLRQYRSSATNPAAAWLWLEDYVYRHGLLVGSERVAEQGGRRHYHLDHLGSPRLVTGVTGSLVSEHDFLPFGEERTSIAQHQDQGFEREEPFRFTSHERDFDNATPNDGSSYVDYMHARHYVTRAGRFLSPDPILGNLLQPQSWNRYAYVLNNPVNLTDPFGLSSKRSGSSAPGNVDCPPDTEGITCFTTTARDPELEKREMAERMMRQMRLRDKVLWTIDAGVSSPLPGGGGAALGVQFSNSGVYPYAGIGFVSSPGWAIVWSPTEASADDSYNVGFNIPGLGPIVGGVGTSASTLQGREWSPISGAIGVGTKGIAITRNHPIMVVHPVVATGNWLAALDRSVAKLYGVPYR